MRPREPCKLAAHTLTDTHLLQVLPPTSAVAPSGRAHAGQHSAPLQPTYTATAPAAAPAITPYSRIGPETRTVLLLLLQSLTPARRAVPQASPGRAALAASPRLMWLMSWTTCGAACRAAGHKQCLEQLMGSAEPPCRIVAEVPAILQTA